MAKGLVTDRYAYKRMAFARKKPQYGWMNIQHMVKGYPKDSRGNLTPIGLQHLRMSKAGVASRGVMGTTRYKGVKIPNVAMSVAQKIQKGTIVTQAIKDERRARRFAAVDAEIARAEGVSGGAFHEYALPGGIGSSNYDEYGGY